MLPSIPVWKEDLRLGFPPIRYVGFRRSSFVPGRKSRDHRRLLWQILYCSCGETSRDSREDLHCCCGLTLLPGPDHGTDLPFQVNTGTIRPAALSASRSCMTAPYISFVHRQHILLVSLGSIISSTLNTFAVRTGFISRKYMSSSSVYRFRNAASPLPGFSISAFSRIVLSSCR